MITVEKIKRETKHKRYSMIYMIHTVYKGQGQNKEKFPLISKAFTTIIVLKTQYPLVITRKK